MDTAGPQTPPSELRLAQTAPAGGATRIEVDGEIDMTTGDAFRQTVARALDEPGLRQLELDLAGLQFIDSNGVSVLIYAHRVAEERGISLLISNTDEVIRSILDLLGVYELLTTGHPG
jgi:anti-anti-sigma factor